jgi:hypothetical protein
MKLAEIKDVRIGQIRQYEDKVFIVRSFEPSWYSNWNGYYYKISYSDDGNNRKSILECEEMMKSEIIGFLNITHELDNDNKLVGIPRDEFEADDVLKRKDRENIIVPIRKYAIRNRTSFMYDCFLCYERENRIYINSFIQEDLQKEYDKIGILGVNYEFINNLLGEQYAR